MRRFDRSVVTLAFTTLVLLGAQQARAQTDITVASEDVAALVAAVNAANADATGPRTIRLARSTYTLTAPADTDGTTHVGLPLFTRSVTILGNGATLERSASATLLFRLMHVSGGTLTVRDLTLRGGNSSSSGGAIYVDSGADCDLERCTLTGNTARLGGGALFIQDVGSFLKQCTIEGNTAGSGGGVDVLAGLIVENCTIVRNQATGSGTGGGIRCTDSTFAESTILALNTAPGGGPQGAGTFALDSCFVDDTSGMTVLDLAGNVLDSGDPLLGPLEDNGGRTPTCALLAGSAAVDAGRGGRPTDQRGADFPRVVGAAIDMGAYEHSDAPFVARVTADDVQATGSTYEFKVRYVSDLATGGIDVTTLDDADLTVTGPNGFSEAASFVSVDVASSGSPRFTVYEVHAPLGGWTEGDNGTYTITLLTDAVLDTARQSVAGGAIATFEVAIDETAPTAAGSAPGVTTAGATSHTITVTYADDAAIDVSTLDDADLVVNPGALAATFVSVDVGTDGTPRVATYTITPPGGTWSAADNGTYTLVLQAGEVTDTSGNAVAAGSAGTFTVAIDTADPAAAATAPDVTDFGETTYTFVVAYTDDLAIDVSTLDDDDVVVNPGGLRATFVSVDATSNGAAREATYRITPPGGSWNAADNDTYTIEVVAGEVTDTSGKAVPAGAVGTFTVSVVDPAAGGSSGDGCSMASAPARSSSAWAPLGLLALVLLVTRRGRAH